MSKTPLFPSAAPRVWARAIEVYGRQILLQAFFFKLRGVLMLPLFIVMFMTTRWELESEPLIWMLGLPTFLAGLALRIAAQRHLKYRLRLASPELATDGPYAYLRNPVYVGNIALLLGLNVLSELPWLVPITLLWTAIVYGFAIRFEEARLLKMFGAEYAAYRDRVPRWLPRRVSGILPDRERRASFARAFAVECHCLLFLLLPVVKELYVD